MRDFSFLVSGAPTMQEQQQEAHDLQTETTWRLKLSQMAIRQGDYSDAIDLLEEIRHERYRMHPATAILLEGTLSVGYCGLGEYRIARNRRLDANSIVKDYCGKQSHHYALGLSILSNIYFRLRDAEMAANACTEALDIFEALELTRHRDYAHAMSNMGDCCTLQGNPQEALIWYSRAKSSLQREKAIRLQSRQPKAQDCNYCQVELEPGQAKECGFLCPVKYCSTRCQRSDWVRHNEQCTKGQ